MSMRDIFRAASVLAVMLAGSCAAPGDRPDATEDGAANHPISVEPSYRSMKLADSATLSADDRAKLADFVDDYIARGNGAISISVPPGPDASQTITDLGEEIVTLGVPRARILVGVQDQAASDGHIDVGFISYEAHADQCGDWSANAAETFDNTTMPNFGCAVQNNIAAEIADPRDLVEPRSLAPADATRRMQMLNKYEQAQTTGAQKTQDQSGAVSDVGGQ